MKRLYLIVLSWFLLLHVWGPTVYYRLFGFFREYLPYSTVSEASVYRAAWMITIPIVIAMGIILLLPMGRGEIKSGDKFPFIYIGFVILLAITKALQTGSFRDKLALTEQSSSLLIYVSLFFDLTTVSLVYILFDERIYRSVLVMVAYALISLLNASRSGLMLLLLFFVCTLAFTSFKNYKKLFPWLMSVMLIGAPLLFVLSTNARGGAQISSLETLTKRVVGRSSIVELAGVVLEETDNGNLNQEIADEKYSLSNQFEQSVNGVSPGALFVQDIDPNQYFGAVFFGLKLPVTSYSSTYMSFTAYLYMKYGYAWAIVGTSGMILFFYFLSSFHLNQKWAALFPILILYEILQFFDFVMITRRIYTIVLTLILFEIFLFLWKFYQERIQKAKVLNGIQLFAMQNRSYLRSNCASKYMRSVEDKRK